MERYHTALTAYRILHNAMAFQSVPECAELVIQAVGDGKAMNNVLGFRFPGGYSALDIQALAIAADARIGSDYLPLIHGNITYISALVRGLQDQNDFSSNVGTSTGPGTASGDLLPTNVTFCITVRTALTGRSARGRFYALPTGASNQSGVNTFSSAYATALVNFLTQLYLDAGAAGWTPVIISRFHNNAARPTGVAFNVVNATFRNRIMDSQRGRLPVGH
jgi:hypothetical protein